MKTIPEIVEALLAKDWKSPVDLLERFCLDVYDNGWRFVHKTDIVEGVQPVQWVTVKTPEKNNDARS